MVINNFVSVTCLEVKTKSDFVTFVALGPVHLTVPAELPKFNSFYTTPLNRATTVAGDTVMTHEVQPGNTGILSQPLLRLIIYIHVLHSSLFVCTK